MPTKSVRELAVCLLALLGTWLSPVPAAASSIFIEWTSAAAGSGGGIDAVVAATITEGGMAPYVQSANAVDYVAEFAASHSGLSYFTETSALADIESTITFSAPLPAGSRLIALDLDQNLETFTFLSDGTAPTLLEQIESQAGQTSIFPSWNPGSGELVALTTAPANNASEASVFDLSGVSMLSVDFRNGGPASGSGIAIALPAPEPSTGLLLVLGALLLSCTVHSDRG